MGWCGPPAAGGRPGRRPAGLAAGWVAGGRAPVGVDGLAGPRTGASDSALSPALSAWRLCCAAASLSAALSACSCACCACSSLNCSASCAAATMLALNPSCAGAGAAVEAGGGRKLGSVEGPMGTPDAALLGGTCAIPASASGTREGDSPRASTGSPAPRARGSAEPTHQVAAQLLAQRLALLVLGSHLGELGLELRRPRRGPSRGRAIPRRGHLLRAVEARRGPHALAGERGVRAGPL